MNDNKDAGRSWGLCPNAPGIYRIVAQGKWHLPWDPWLPPFGRVAWQSFFPIFDPVTKLVTAPLHILLTDGFFDG